MRNRREGWQCKATGLPSICWAREEEGHVPSLPLWTPFLQWWSSIRLELYREVLFSLIISIPTSAPEYDQTWNTIYQEQTPRVDHRYTSHLSSLTWKNPHRCLHVTEGYELHCSCNIKLIMNCSPSPGKVSASEMLIRHMKAQEDKTRWIQHICNTHNFGQSWSRDFSHRPLPACQQVLCLPCLPETTRGTCVQLFPLCRD